MKYQNLRDRTFQFALGIVEYCQRVPDTWEARRLAGQLFDAGTSVGANYRAAQRGRSHREFISKIGLVIEEADESAFWLDLMKAAGIGCGFEQDRLLAEATELRAIFVASKNTARLSLGEKKARSGGT